MKERLTRHSHLDKLPDPSANAKRYFDELEFLRKEISELNPGLPETKINDIVFRTIKASEYFKD